MSSTISRRAGRGKPRLNGSYPALPPAGATNYFYIKFTLGPSARASHIGMTSRQQFAFVSFAAAFLALGATMFAKGDAAQGKNVFQQCAVCHNADVDEKKVGPSLKGLFERKKLKNGKSVSDENVLAQINNGGGGMPPFAEKLSQGEKDNLIAYLHTL